MGDSKYTPKIVLRSMHYITIFINMIKNLAIVFERDLMMGRSGEKFFSSLPGRYSLDQVYLAKCFLDSNLFSRVWVGPCCVAQLGLGNAAVKQILFNGVECWV